jgi:GT2 family glycosyltransferase
MESAQHSCEALMMMPEFSICLLTYNRRAHLIRRWEELATLYIHRPDVELCILNNGSVDGTEDTLGAWVTKPVPLLYGVPVWRTVYRTISPNISAGPGFNALVSMSTGRTVVILADDVRVAGDFLEPIHAVLEVTAGKGLVGQEMVDFAGTWNQFGDNPPIPYIAAHILGLRRTVWDAIGGFDPIFQTLSYEDMDLSYRAVKMGYSLEKACMPVEHLFMSLPRHAGTIRNRALFAAKWNLPNVPADIPDNQIPFAPKEKPS